MLVHRHPSVEGHRRSEGQILVIFVLAMVAMIGDGRSRDRRRQHLRPASRPADGNRPRRPRGGERLPRQHSNSPGDDPGADRRPRTNGFTQGSDSTNVGVTITTSNGVEVTVDIASPHHNSFLGALGMATWNVSTTATALAGFPDTGNGAGPFIFPISAFNDDGTPKYHTPTDFGETNGDVPTSQTDIAWTNYGTGNVNTQGVADIITGDVTINKTLSYGEYIGQHNNGNHTTLYGDVNTYLSGLDMPVAVVDAGGNFMGWATFHVVKAPPAAHRSTSPATSRPRSQTTA